MVRYRWRVLALPEPRHIASSGSFGEMSRLLCSTSSVRTRLKYAATSSTALVCASPSSAKTLSGDTRLTARLIERSAPSGFWPN